MKRLIILGLTVASICSTAEADLWADLNPSAHAQLSSHNFIVNSMSQIYGMQITASSNGVTEYRLTEAAKNNLQRRMNTTAHETSINPLTHISSGCEELYKLFSE